ncbi:MAG: dTDP-4-dehydrorhamnose 3,5-epimerase [Holosporales bacterium]
MFTRLSIPEVILITPKRFGDARGWFSEVYSTTLFQQNGITDVFIQDNQSFSAAPGTLRGLHFQHPPYAQAKLVRVVRGSVLDVAVDIRRGSPTFGQYAAAELTAEHGEQLYVPAGFAHGFLTRTPDTEVLYKVSAAYAPTADAGYRFDDPTFAIKWGAEASTLTLSDKDAKLPFLTERETPFVYG